MLKTDFLPTAMSKAFHVSIITSIFVQPFEKYSGFFLGISLLKAFLSCWNCFQTSWFLLLLNRFLYKSRRNILCLRSLSTQGAYVFLTLRCRYGAYQSRIEINCFSHYNDISFTSLSFRIFFQSTCSKFCLKDLLS